MEHGGLCIIRLYQIPMIAPKESPTLYGLPVLFEHGLGLGFGQVVTALLVSWTLDNGELALLVAIPEPVPLGKKVLGPACNALVCHKEVSALVVLEHCGMDS
jgi:hypothetical protein